MGTEAPKDLVVIIAEQSTNLDTICYRGAAPIADLARISVADVFDQVTNPDGLQRDLSKKHALEAYEYVAAEPRAEHPRAFPEVVLNVRDRGVCKVEPVNLPAGVPVRLVKLTFDLGKIERAKTPKVSRVDGNHRLMFADGDGKDRPPLAATAPFQLHLGLSREQEASLFLDINAEQKGLNTSHLRFLRSRLTSDVIEKHDHPARWMARRLAEDVGSPWHELVHYGGSKVGSKEAGVVRPLNFTALESGVRRTLTRSTMLSDLTDVDARYKLVRTFWRATAEVWPEAFDRPAEYLLARNIGVQVMSTVAAPVIDRCMAQGDVEQHDMRLMLEAAAPAVNWSSEVSASAGGVGGLSGNRAALELANLLIEALPKHPQAAKRARDEKKVAPPVEVEVPRSEDAAVPA